MLSFSHCVNVSFIGPEIGSVIIFLRHVFHTHTLDEEKKRETNKPKWKRNTRKKAHVKVSRNKETTQL